MKWARVGYLFLSLLLHLPFLFFLGDKRFVDIPLSSRAIRWIDLSFIAESNKAAAIRTSVQKDSLQASPKKILPPVLEPLVNADSSGNAIDQDAYVVKKYPVHYPVFARMNGLSGSVMARLQIGEEGRVVNVELVHATLSIFQDEALRALSHYQFQKKLAGQSILYQLDFVLDESRFLVVERR